PPGVRLLPPKRRTCRLNQLATTAGDEAPPPRRRGDPVRNGRGLKPPARPAPAAAGPSPGEAGAGPPGPARGPRPRPRPGAGRRDGSAGGRGRVRTTARVRGRGGGASPALRALDDEVVLRVVEGEFELSRVTRPDVADPDADHVPRLVPDLDPLSLFPA